MISSGANDLLYVQTPGVVVSPDYLPSLASRLATSVATLQADGARTIVVLNVYDYARLVDANGNLSATDAANVAQASSFGAAVWSNLAAAGVNFVPADVEGLLKYVSRNPTRFGFAPATELASSPACATPASLVCAPGQLVTPDAEQTYLFAKKITAPSDHGGADHRGRLHLQPAVRAKSDLAVDGKRRAGRVGTHDHHPAADRAFRSTSRTERKSISGRAPEPAR